MFYGLTGRWLDGHASTKLYNNTLLFYHYVYIFSKNVHNLLLCMNMYIYFCTEDVMLYS